MKNGIHHKYNVTRADGSSGPGGKHQFCAYFVLDLDHDENALVALAAYRDAVLDTNPQLAKDLHAIIRAQERKDNTRCNCREVGCGHSLAQALTPGAGETAMELMNAFERRSR